MNENRRALVRAAFKKLDANGNGVITLDDLALSFDPSQHKEVIKGRKTADEVIREMMFCWDCSDRDGAVTFAEFEDYYEGVSASFKKDHKFERMMKRAWKLE